MKPKNSKLGPLGQSPRNLIGISQNFVLFSASTAGSWSSLALEIAEPKWDKLLRDVNGISSLGGR